MLGLLMFAASVTWVPLTPISLDVCQYALHEEVSDDEMIRHGPYRDFTARFDAKAREHHLTAEQRRATLLFCDGYVLGVAREYIRSNQH